MSDSWYYVRDKKKLGPVAWDQLQQLVRTGQLALTDMILKTGSTKWQAVKELAELLTAKPQGAADEWFYVQDKKKSGPVAFAQLKELASSGKLLVNDMVIRAGQSKWQHAGDVSGLFPLAPVEEHIEDEEEEHDEDESLEEQVDELDADEIEGDEEEIDVDPYLDRARQFQDQGDYGRAIAEFQELVRLLPTEPEGFNGLAWIMATCSDARFRNGSRAVQYARRAVELHSQSEEAEESEGIACVVAAVEYQKTLAAAHAEAGDFAAALAALDAGLATAPVVERPRLNSYRMLYRLRRPFRELPAPAPTKN